MFRIYAHQKGKGWILVDAKKDEQEAIETAEELNPKDYYSYLVVKVTENGETVIKRENFTRNEFVKKLKVEINEEPIKPYKKSRTKKKEELRRLIDFGDDDYLNY